MEPTEKQQAFIEAWNAAASPKELAEALGAKSTASVSVRASQLRRKGFELKKFGKAKAGG